jgi:NADP-dependent 3-hydroxy acid dehydrogenase YdfG
MALLRTPVVAVTGASSGIGRAVTLKLAKHGARVYLIGRNRTSLEETRDAAGAAKDRMEIFEADLADDRSLTSLAADLARVLKGLDVLVHSAGIISLGTIGAAKIEDFDSQYRVNVRAPFYLTQVLLPALRARRGQVVFINSSAGLHPRAGLAGYCASKHALKALADVLRDEVSGEGIRVLSLFPGRTATRMQSEILAAEKAADGTARLMPPEDVAEVIFNILRLDRKAEVTDIHIRPTRK